MKHINLLFLFCLVFGLSNSYTQWELRYPDIPTDFINDMTFTSESHGYFVNEGGSIYETSDGGLIWNNKKFIADHNLYKIKFSDAQTGFSYTRKNVIYQGDIPLLYTTNAGNNWQESHIELWGSKTFLPVSSGTLLRANTEISVLNNFFGNWRTALTLPTFFIGDSTLQEEISYGSIFQFEKLDNHNILALGNSHLARNYNIISDSISFILISTDNGEVWDTLWCDFPYEMKSLSFANSTTGWLTGEGERIYKTTNGGASWFLQHADSVSPTPRMIEQVFVLDENNIFASTLNDILVSNDGGSSWQSYSFPQFNSLKIYFNDPLNGFAYGTDLLRTTNGGTSWTRVSTSIKDDIVRIKFINEFIGWAMSYSKLYHTTDGGYNWSEQFSFESSTWPHLGLEFINASKGWMVSWNSAFYTVDGSQNWDTLYADNNFTFFGGYIDFHNNELGVLGNLVKESVPGSGIYDISGMMVTTNGGSSWQTIGYPQVAEYIGFRKIKFTTSDSLWAINNKGIWLSNDTAKTWQQVYTANNFSGSYSFDFINALDGCFSDAGYDFKFTENAGQTWQSYSLRKYIFIRDYQIVGKDISNNYRIFAVGYDGRLLKYTMNGWNPDFYPNSFTSKNLNSLSLFMKDRLPHLWAGGDGFTILHGTTELVTDLQIESHNIVSSFQLAQNYPNPFNPSTKISWQSPVSSHQTLKVYDVLGREVATLVYEYKEAGYHEVEFLPGSIIKNPASGVYFYQLKAGNYINTKKMILLR